MNNFNPELDHRHHSVHKKITNMEETKLQVEQSTAEKNPHDTREEDPLSENEKPTFGEKIKVTYQYFIRFWNMFSSLLKAFITRIIFTLHFLLAYWVVIVQVKWKFGYWFLPLGLFGLLLESIVTFYIRKGAEYKWYCIFLLLNFSGSGHLDTDLNHYSKNIAKMEMSNCIYIYILNRLNYAYISDLAFCVL